jgi:hypothetical protein
LDGAETRKNAPQRLVGNRYAVHEVIGQGGLGVVRRGHDTLLGRQIALKEIRLLSALPGSRASSARSRLLQEARASAVLNHAHVVTVHDIVQDDDGGGLHIVMELLDGRDLTQLVEEEGCLSPQRAAAIGLQVLDALGAAHAKGVVHRDVKPGNVMVMQGDRAKLGDFGLASLADGGDLTPADEVLGTPSYMAPEQAFGDDPSPSADLWGLGATLYYATEGVAPFDAGSSLATMHAVLHAPPRPHQRAGALSGVLDRLLTKRPEERPGPDELRALLAEVATGGGSRESGRLPAASAQPQGPSATHPAAGVVPTAGAAGRRVAGWVAVLVAGLVVLLAVLLAGPVPITGPPGTGGEQPIAGAVGPERAVVPPPAAPTTVPPQDVGGATPVVSPPPPDQTGEDAAVTTTAAAPTTTRDGPRPAPPTPPPPPFVVEARTATGQGNAAGLPAGAGTIELTTRIVDARGREVAGLKMSKSRAWDGVRVRAPSAPQLEPFDDPGRGVTFLGLDDPVVDRATQGGRTHTSRAVAVFRACGPAGDCTELRALVEIVAFGDGTFDTRRGSG